MKAFVIHDNDCGLYPTVKEGSLKTYEEICHSQICDFYKDHSGGWWQKGLEKGKNENRLLKGSLQYELQIVAGGLDL